MRWLLLLVILIPAIEIGVFIWLGSIVGPWWVVTMIFLSGIIGIWLARHEGLDIWYQANQSIQKGRVPTEQIIDGVCVLVGAIFLLTPGFITDVIGLILVIPFTRLPLKQLLIQWIRWKIQQGKIVYRK